VAKRLIGSFGVNLWRLILTNRDGGTLFPNYFKEDFVTALYKTTYAYYVSRKTFSSLTATGAQQ